jgi:ABC-type dipeptide/oligopeptide/nickel transport system permease subunit
MNVRYRVELSQAERDELTTMLGKGKCAARKLKRAQILLAADVGCGDEEIARSVAVGGSTVYLGVGVGSALLAALVGAALGLIAAYAGGKIDALIMRLVDLHLSFPSILVALMILALLGKGIVNVMLALVIAQARPADRENLRRLRHRGLPAQ